MAIARFHLERSALLVVDMQARLLPVILDGEAVEGAVCQLIDGANALGVPVLVTEQYRKGLGETVAEVESRLGGAVCRAEKLKFSALVEPVRTELAERGVRSVAVCGVETHVCVLQTCLDLAAAGYLTAVVTDAAGSRRRTDHEAAMARMVQAGVLPTTVESLLLEWVHEAGTERFKAVLDLIR